MLCLYQAKMALCRTGTKWECGKQYFIPCLTQGGAFRTFPDVYPMTGEVIAEISNDIFNEL